MDPRRIRGKDTCQLAEPPANMLYADQVARGNGNKDESLASVAETCCSEGRVSTA
jgi:hypothetical protein